MQKTINKEPMKTIEEGARQKNILFVDNDKLLTLDIQDLIERQEIEDKFGLNFMFVKEVKGALKKLSESTIDLIVLEIVLPVVNGYYFLTLLKEKHPNIPVIIYTRLKDPQDLAKMADYNVDNIFLKELMKAEDLIAIIGKKETTKEDIDHVVMELKSQVKALSDKGLQKQLKLVQCPRCNLIIAPDSHFCNNCGQKIIKKTKKSLSANSEKKEKSKSTAVKPAQTDVKADTATKPKENVKNKENK